MLLLQMTVEQRVYLITHLTCSRNKCGFCISASHVSIALESLVVKQKQGDRVQKPFRWPTSTMPRGTGQMISCHSSSSLASSICSYPCRESELNNNLVLNRLRETSWLPAGVFTFSLLTTSICCFGWFSGLVSVAATDFTATQSETTTIKILYSTGRGVVTMVKGLPINHWNALLFLVLMFLQLLRLMAMIAMGRSFVCWSVRRAWLSSRKRARASASASASASESESESERHTFSEGKQASFSLLPRRHRSPCKRML